MSRLQIVDAKKRPLFAQLVAEASGRGDYPPPASAIDLISDFVDRTREHYWRPNGATAKEERLLAIATMANGIGRGWVEHWNDDILPSWDIDKHPDLMRLMSGGEQSTSPLEPDLVGELFVLNCLSSPQLTDDMRRRLCDYAWSVRPLGMSHFIVRCQTDFASHKCLPLLRDCPAVGGLTELYWAGLCVDLLAYLEDGSTELAEQIFASLDSVVRTRNDEAFWEAWSRCAANLLNAKYTATLPRRLALIAELATLSQRYLTDSFVQSWLVAVNSTILRCSGAPVYELFEKSCRLLQLHQRDDILTDWGESVALAAAEKLSAIRDQKAWVVFAEIGKLAELFGSIDVWRNWASCGGHIVYAFGVSSTTRCINLLSEVASCARRHEDEIMWARWANGSRHLILVLRDHDPKLCWQILASILEQAKLRDEAGLWEESASGLVNLAKPRPGREDDIIWSYLQTIGEPARARGEHTLALEWCKALVNVTTYLQPNHAPLAWDSIRVLDELVIQYPTEEVFDRWARVTLNLATFYSKNDPNVCRIFLNRMWDGLTKPFGNAIRIHWTYAVNNVIAELSENDCEQAFDLLNKTQTLASLHDDIEMWKTWIKGAAFLSNRLHRDRKHHQRAVFLQERLKALPPVLIERILKALASE